MLVLSLFSMSQSVYLQIKKAAEATSYGQF